MSLIGDNSSGAVRASILQQIAVANNVTNDKVDYLALGAVSGVQYLYDTSTQVTYYSVEELTGEITDLGTDSNGVRTIVVGGTGYEIEKVRSTAVDYGFIVDGVTDNATLISSLDSLFDNLELNLNGETLYTSTLPTNIVFTNGYVNYSGTTVNADDSPSVISGSSDSGGLLAAYSGGVEDTPTTSGRTTKNMYGVFASQNCRSEIFPRTVNIGSIYSWAYGNVSGNYSSRQCVAAAPQTVNIASEECQAYGFRGANISSQYTFAQESSSNISSRYSYANAPRSANIASVNASTGEGGKARLSVVVASGSVSSVTIDDGGENYVDGTSLVFYDRTSSGSGAVATISVDGSGTIDSVTVSDGGSGYSDTVDAIVDCDGDYSANIATTNTCVTSAEASANIASNSSKARGTRSANIATDECETSGVTSSNIASISSTASGVGSANIGSSGCTASGILSAALAANNCEASGDGAVVMGRRAVNNVNRSVAFGDASSGDASTANRTFHLYSNGNMSIAGTLTQSATFTDIAKMFENKVSGVEIPVGSLVCIDGREVRLATEGDDVNLLSAHSRTYVQLLGDSSFTWSGRYQRDEFGQFIYGDVLDEDSGEYITRVLENEDYSEDLEQIPRSERVDEWTPVAMLGEVFIRVDSTVYDGCMVGAGSTDGLGTLSDIGLYCMEVTTEYSDDNGYAVALCLVK